MDTYISEVHIPFLGKLPSFYTAQAKKGGETGTQSDDRNTFIVSSVLLFSGSFSLPMHINASF